MSIRRLQSELKQIIKDPNYHYSISPDENNFYKWNFIIIGPEETLFEGGIFKGNITFKKEYPNIAPKVIITSEIFHPNIYKNGTVCMSILHNGSDAYGYENDSIRWNPTQGVNSVMLSLISILSDPNTESPANIDASNMFSKDVDEYKKRVRKIVQNSQL
jgi:ubiquitin-conjugating enzyme E2 G1